MALLILMLMTIFTRSLNINKVEATKLNDLCQKISAIGHTNVFAETQANCDASKLLKKYDTTSIPHCDEKIKASKKHKRPDILHHPGLIPKPSANDNPYEQL